MRSYDNWFRRIEDLARDHNLPLEFVHERLADHVELQRQFDDGFAVAEVVMHWRRQFRVERSESEAGLCSGLLRRHFPALTRRGILAFFRPKRVEVQSWEEQESLRQIVSGVHPDSEPTADAYGKRYGRAKKWIYYCANRLGFDLEARGGTGPVTFTLLVCFIAVGAALALGLAIYVVATTFG